MKSLHVTSCCVQMVWASWVEGIIQVSSGSNYFMVYMLGMVLDGERTLCIDYLLLLLCICVAVFSY